MIVLATNAPQLLDEAVQDRIDESVNFEKPTREERMNILYLYIVQYCRRECTFTENFHLFCQHPTSLFNRKIKINSDALSEEYVKEISRRTENFSGRELTKLVVSWHDAAFSKDKPILDKQTIEEVLNRHIEQNLTKRKWNLEQKENFKTIHSMNNQVL
jgi:ATPase family AAA domain-containing protein 3A/B